MPLAVSGPIGWLPESPVGVPNQAPEAVQESAFVDDQVSVEDPLFVTDGGLATSDTVGTGGGGGVENTVTVAVALALPPELVQVRE